MSGALRQFTARKQAAAGGFDPSDVAGLVLWVDADAITGLSNDDPVATWSDLSGAGNDLTQATEASQPLYKTAVINGYPSVAFSGSSLFNALSVPQPYTAFAVARRTATSSNGVVWDNASGTGYSRLAINSGTQEAPYLYANFSFRNFSNAASASVFYVFSANMDDTETVAEMDGVVQATGSPGTGGMTGVSVGAYDPSGTPTDFLTGDIAELLVYSNALSAADRDSVTNYLGDKYAITIA